MKAVNLLPPERRGGPQSFDLKPRQPLLLGVAGIVGATVLGVGVWVYSAGSGISGKEQQLSALQRQVAAAKATKPTGSASDALTASSRMNDVVSVVSRRMAWDGFLGSFAHVVPEDVWLLSLTASPSGVASTASASSSSSSSSSSTTPTSSDQPFTISGYTYSQPSVARLLDRLALIPWLQNVQLQNSVRTVVANRALYQFTIGASMLNPGEGVTS